MKSTLQGADTLARLLAPYRQEAVAEAVGASKSAVHCWYHGLTLPRDEHVPRLAGFLRVPIGQLAELIAEERKQRSLERLGASA